MKAQWKTTLDASKAEALLAVDLYNQSNQSRRLEAFFVHMHLAWLYLFEAQYQYNHLRYHYYLPNGHYQRVDGEPKTWDLAKFVKEELTFDQPVRKNLELTISLRNKIEHRFEEATTVVVAGYAQSLLLNYEERLTVIFGNKQSLGSELRFPVFIGSLTHEGSIQLANVQKQLPNKTRRFLTEFESQMDPLVMQDHHYEFRVRLIPKIGSKSEADLALTFVREVELTDVERQMLSQQGKSGTVIVREHTRSVSNEDNMKPVQAAAAIETRIPFEFKIHHLVSVWKRLQLHPPIGDAQPERTQQDFCIWDRPHRDYLYTKAFVDHIVDKSLTADGFKEVTGYEPKKK